MIKDKKSLIDMFPYDFIKKCFEIIMLLGILGLCLTGCSETKESINPDLTCCSETKESINPDLTGCSEKKESINPNYLKRFDIAIEHMSKKSYNLAEEEFQVLKEDLDKDSSSSNEITELKADVDYVLGKLYFNEGYYNRAYDFYNSAYIYYRSIMGDDANKTIDTRLQLAELEYTYLGHKEHALSEFLDIYETVDALEYKNVALCDVVAVYINMDSGTETEKYIGLIQELVDNVRINKTALLETIKEEEGTESEALRKNVSGRIMRKTQYLYACSVLGNYYIECKDPDEAIKTYQTALDLLECLENDNEESKIDFYDSLGFVYLFFKGEAEANEYLNKALEIIDRVYPSGTEKASLYISVAEMYLAMEDYEKFRTYLKDATEMMTETIGENHRIVALSKTLLSEYYIRMGEFQQAIVSCEEAIEIKRNILEEDSDTLGACYNRLANCYAMGGYKKESIDSYLKSIEIYKEAHNELQVAVASRNIALIYNNSLHEHSLALQYAREAISLVESMDEEYYGGTIAAIYMVMLDILTSTDYEYQFIEEYAEKAYWHLQRAVGNTNEEMGNYHYNLGKYLSDNNRYPEALTHLVSAETLFEIVYQEISLFPVDIFHDIAYCYYSTGFYDKALEYFENSVDYTRKHIALLNGQGNYWTLYWENSQNKSKGFIDNIISIQKAETEHLFGGRYLDDLDELIFYNEDLDGNIEFSVSWYHLYETGTIKGVRKNNLIAFNYPEDSERVLSGSINLKDNEAVLTITYSGIEGIGKGEKHFIFLNDEYLAEKTRTSLLENSEIKGWVRNYPAVWQSKTYLHFYEEGKVSVWTELKEGEYSVEEKTFAVISEHRILIGEVEYSISLFSGGLYISSIHSDELQLGGFYDLMNEDVALQVLSKNIS